MKRRAGITLLFWSFLVIQEFSPHPEGLPEPRRFSHIGRFATKEQCERVYNDLLTYFGTQEVYKGCHEHEVESKDDWEIFLTHSK